MSKRSLRRHRTKMLKVRCLKLGKKLRYPTSWALKNYNNMTVCSCSMCGNPRKHFGISTRQEIRSKEDLRDGQAGRFGVVSTEVNEPIRNDVQAGYRSWKSWLAGEADRQVEQGSHSAVAGDWRFWRGTAIASSTGASQGDWCPFEGAE